MYDVLRANIERDTVNMIYHVGIMHEPPPPPVVRNVHENRQPDAEPAGRANGAPRAAAPIRNGARTATAPVAVGSKPQGRSQ
ncbi:MAG: hypothetical protein KatS3mg060_0918 [Dehalococcoidia bacterium]|nr:MAG: hypothetical protein KatS3mg060_0918 [Dehalococcoidia bacterium]